MQRPQRRGRDDYDDQQTSNTKPLEIHQKNPPRVTHVSDAGPSALSASRATRPLLGSGAYRDVSSFLLSPRRSFYLWMLEVWAATFRWDGYFVASVVLAYTVDLDSMAPLTVFSA